jgi:hypothetical protein
MQKTQYAVGVFVSFRRLLAARGPGNVFHRNSSDCGRNQVRAGRGSGHYLVWFDGKNQLQTVL